MKNPFRKTLVPVLDLVLPRVCIVCGRRLLTFEKHICTCCLADLPLTFNWILPHNPMADRFNELIQESLCRTLQDGVTPSGHVAYSHAAALFFFNSEADYRKIPYSIKYRGDLASGLFFGAMLGKRMAEASALQDIDLIMPVPLYWSRKWKRGYNQAEVIARGIAEAVHGPVCTDILYRKHRTATQTRLDVNEKLRNVDNAFGLRKPLPPKTEHILLVDDVFTTGATLHACYRTLMATGKDIRISIATLAMVSN